MAADGGGGMKDTMEACYVCIVIVFRFLQNSPSFSVVINVYQVVTND